MARHLARCTLALAAIATLALPLGAAAQPAWTASTEDSGTYLFAHASDPGGTLGVGCTAPSPQGRPAIETGSHESHVTPPYGVVIEFADTLFDWPDSYRLDNVVLYLDGTGYRLPPVILDELAGTAVQLPMTDQMVLGLYGVQRLVLDTGTGKAYDYPTAGIGAALDTALLYCVSRWVALGHPLPAALARFAATPPAPAGGDLVAIAQAHVDRQCNGRGSVGAQAVAFGDIDGDGAPDILVDWSNVTCAGDWPRPFCGASLCSGDVLLSRNGHVMREGDALLGMSHVLVPLDNGNAGISSTGNLSMCQSTGPCGFLTYWTGAGLNSTQF